MKKMLYRAAFMAVALLLLQLCAYAATDTVGTREQLVEYLTQQVTTKPASIPFNYTSALNKKIEDSTWMSEVLNDVGILNARWSYGGGKCTLKSIEYMPDHVVCTTEKEVVAALKGVKNGVLNIRMPKALYSQLRANEFARLRQLEAEVGIASRKMGFYENSCLVLYSGIEYEKNFTSISSYTELKNLMRSYQNLGVTTCTIHCSDELFKELISNEFLMLHMMESEVGIVSRKLSYDSESHYFMYSDIKFAENFKSVSTLAELSQQMMTFRSMGQSAYSIHCSAALYRLISANEFAVLHQLEGEIGFADSTMSYSDTVYRITYSDIEYMADFIYVQSLDEVKQWMQYCSYELKDAFAFSCPEDLYNELAKADFEYLHAVEANCGVYKRDMTYYDGKRMVIYTGVQYYPGYYVAQSVRLGRTGAIKGRMLTLYNEARSILREVRLNTENDPLALQFALQEAIMSRTEYLKGETSGDHDTAYGALLNGLCECDGYADAFYLLADLAGLEVRFQTGVDIDDGEHHLWNVIRHGGQWYFTDLTWCDMSDDYCGLFSNIGMDIAKGCYEWVEGASIVPLASYTSSRYYYYSLKDLIFSSPEQAAAYVNKQLGSGSRRVEILLSKPANEDASDFAERFTDRLDVSYRSTYKHTRDFVAFIFYPWQ